MSTGAASSNQATLGTLRGRAEAYFEFPARNAALSIEIWGGVSTFLALSYIFVVNPAILAEAGIPRDAVFFATVIASSLATLLMGLWARLPFAVAPGLEMNAFVAVSVVASYGFSWQQALGLCFVSSILMLTVTASRLRARFLEALPPAMRTSLAAMVGVFVGLIALQITNIISYEDGHLAGIESPFTLATLVLAIGAATVWALHRRGMRSAVIVSIAVATGFSYLFGIGGSPLSQGSSEMFAGVGALSFEGIIGTQALSVVVVLFLLDFFGSAAKFIGLSDHTEITSEGRVPNMTRGLMLDGAASAVGASLGTSTLTTFVESGVGIRAGARTGLSAVVCALLMLAVLPFSDLASYVPVIATGGALIFVAVALWPSPSAIAAQVTTDRLALAAMLAVVIATFALDRAILAGFAVYIAGSLIERSRPSAYLLGSTALLAFGVALQYA